LAQQGLLGSDLFMEFGDARSPQQPFDGIDLPDLASQFDRLARIPTGDTRGEQIELQQIAQRLEISRIREQCGVDLPAEPVGHKQLLEGAGMPPP
jgi:hypothetical protein